MFYEQSLRNITETARRAKAEISHCIYSTSLSGRGTTELTPKIPSNPSVSVSVHTRGETKDDDDYGAEEDEDVELDYNDSRSSLPFDSLVTSSPTNSSLPSTTPRPTIVIRPFSFRPPTTTRSPSTTRQSTTGPPTTTHSHSTTRPSTSPITSRPTTTNRPTTTSPQSTSRSPTTTRSTTSRPAAISQPPVTQPSTSTSRPTQTTTSRSTTTVKPVNPRTTTTAAVHVRGQGQEDIGSSFIIGSRNRPLESSQVPAHNRPKRLIEPVTTALLVGAGIYVLASVTAGWNLFSRVSALEQKIEKVGIALNATVSVSEEFISINDLRGEKLEDTIGAIKDIKYIIKYIIYCWALFS